MTDDPSDAPPPYRSPFETPPDQAPPSNQWPPPPSEQQPPYPPQPYQSPPPYPPQHPYAQQQPSPYDPQSYQQPYGNQYWPAQPQNAGTNGLAIASLVLGIVWVFWLGSILAVIFGHIALGQIKRSGQSGKGMAVAGLVLGYIGIAWIAFFFVMGLVEGIRDSA
jgi:hypothetical protein